MQGVLNGCEKQNFMRRRLGILGFASLLLLAAALPVHASNAPQRIGAALPCRIAAANERNPFVPGAANARALCRAFLSHDPAVCYTLDGDDRTFCEVVADRQESHCYALASRDAHNFCYAFLSYANSAHSQAFCDAILSSDSHHFCLAMFVTEASHREAFCRMVEDGTTRTLCLAFANQDASYCDGLGRGLRSYCSAIVVKSAKLCEDITVALLWNTIAEPAPGTRGSH